MTLTDIARLRAERQDLERRLQLLGENRKAYLEETHRLGKLIRETLQEASRAGMSVREIADLTGISKTRVHVILSMEGDVAL